MKAGHSYPYWGVYKNSAFETIYEAEILMIEETSEMHAFRPGES